MPVRKKVDGENLKLWGNYVINIPEKMIAIRRRGDKEKEYSYSPLNKVSKSIKTRMINGVKVKAIDIKILPNNEEPRVIRESNIWGQEEIGIPDEMLYFTGKRKYERVKNTLTKTGLIAKANKKHAVELKATQKINPEQIIIRPTKEKKIFITDEKNKIVDHKNIIDDKKEKEKPKPKPKKEKQPKKKVDENNESKYEQAQKKLSDYSESLPNFRRGIMPNYVAKKYQKLQNDVNFWRDKIKKAEPKQKPKPKKEKQPKIKQEPKKNEDPEEEKANKWALGIKKIYEDVFKLIPTDGTKEQYKQIDNSLNEIKKMFDDGVNKGYNNKIKMTLKDSLLSTKHNTEIAFERKKKEALKKKK